MIGEIDRRAWSKGYVIIGIDEVGRGPLAGPVSAGAVVMECDPEVEGINDSKKISEKKRERIAKRIQDTCITSVVHRSNEVVDEIGLRTANFQAMQLAFIDVLHKWRARSVGSKYANYPARLIWLLVDGPDKVPNSWPHQKAIVRGDSTSLAIAAASIVAKVTRDRLLIEYDQKWPQYGFAKHKGYGTPQHMQAIWEHGPCPIHRRSIKSVKKKEYHEEWITAQERGAPWYELQRLGAYE